MAGSPEARSPFALIDEVEQAREVLVLTYTSALDYFERFALSDARALGALVTLISDATMVHADPMVVRRAGTQYLDARAVCPAGAFHPKLLVIVGEGQARVAIGSGNLTMAGWHANAEMWTVLRADQDGGPGTLRDVSGFLRALATSEVALSPGANTALGRVADELDVLPADDPGPVLVHSLQTPIAEQLPVEGSVDELVMYAPFHDARLAATRALLDRLQPTTWTVFVREDTEVDGGALSALVSEREGKIAWVSHQAEQADGSALPDERYWHGKLIQWRQADKTWALSGSPNLSAPALMRAVSGGGNCELALVAEVETDLRPPAGDPPDEGVAALSRTSADDERASDGLVLLSAIVQNGAVTVLLHAPLSAEGVLQRYDLDADHWRTSATLPPGLQAYEVDVATAPIGQAVRILRDDQATSNSVFVADPERLRRRQVKALGKVRLSPAEVARLGLGQQLLADLEELRPHLLRVGVTVQGSAGPADGEASDNAAEGGTIPSARPAAGISLEDYLAACDPVLGLRATEFALVLPALPGVGAALDESAGTLDSDDDSDPSQETESRTEPTLADELERAAPNERERYRRFLERLITRSAAYPMVIRTLAARSVLHAVAAGIWPERWPVILTDSLSALGASGDEPNEHERAAAGSLAAAGLALLRTDVLKLSRLDEHTMRYEAAGRAVAALLPYASPERIDLLAAELPEHLAGATGVLAAERAIDEALHPPKGAERAARLLSEEYQLAASVTSGQIIELQDALDGAAEPRLLLALSLADDVLPIYVRGRTSDGRPVLAVWQEPWLAIERDGPNGPWGRAWKLSQGQTPGMLRWDSLPKAALHWAAGQPRPEQVLQLLTVTDHAGGG